MEAIKKLRDKNIFNDQSIVESMIEKNWMGSPVIKRTECTRPVWKKTKKQANKEQCKQIETNNTRENFKGEDQKIKIKAHTQSKRTSTRQTKTKNKLQTCKEHTKTNETNKTLENKR